MGRKRREKLFKLSCLIVTLVAISVLGILIYHILKEGMAWLNWTFIENFPSRRPTKAGIKSALVGSIYLISLTALFAVPLGVATAIFLEEYCPKGKLWHFFRLNIANLAGMPSIIYGLVGLSIFVRYFGFGRSLLAGALTLALLVLPIIIIASQEALHAVPNSIREAGFALGA